MVSNIPDPLPELLPPKCSSISKLPFILRSGNLRCPQNGFEATNEFEPLFCFIITYSSSQSKFPGFLETVKLINRTLSVNAGELEIFHEQLALCCAPGFCRVYVSPNWTWAFLAACGSFTSFLTSHGISDDSPEENNKSYSTDCPENKEGN